jgi:hypothetical protein
MHSQDLLGETVDEEVFKRLIFTEQICIYLADLDQTLLFKTLLFWLKSRYVIDLTIRLAF